MSFSLFRLPGLIGAGLLTLSVAACSLIDPPPKPACPNVLVPRDTSQVIWFKPGPGRDLTDVVVQAEFEGFQGSCAYDVDDKRVNFRLNPVMIVERGPSTEGTEVTLPYFIAVTNPDNQIIMKREIDAEFTMPSTLIRGRVRDEEVEIELQLEDLFEGPNYTFYLGFQLSQEQLDYNRESRVY